MSSIPSLALSAILLAGIVTLSGCRDKNWWLICTIDGAETHRQATPYVAIYDIGYKTANGWYTPKPGELCRMEENNQ